MINIRSLANSDMEVWAHMRHQLWPEANVKSHLRELTNLMKSGQFFGWGAFRQITAVGFAEIYIRPFANGCESQPVPFLEGIWINPNFRRQDIGKHLIATIENWAVAKGFRELGSDTELERTESQIAHEKWGFVEKERVVCYVKPLAQ